MRSRVARQLRDYEADVRREWRANDGGLTCAAQDELDGSRQVRELVLEGKWDEAMDVAENTSGSLAAEFWDAVNSIR